MGNRTKDEVMRCRFGSKAAPRARRADHTAKSISEGLRMEAQTAVIKLRDDDPLLRHSLIWSPGGLHTLASSRRNAPQGS